MPVVGTCAISSGNHGVSIVARDVQPLARMRLSMLALVVLPLGACATSTTPDTSIRHVVEAAAAEAGVPADLMMAIAIEEGGVRLPRWRMVSPDDNVPVGGALELRHGRLDTLALGARLLGTTQDALRSDTDLGTRAGAYVLASLGATADRATWRSVLEKLSGMDDASASDYATRVLSILRTGGEFTARDGETVQVSPHPEIGDRELAPTVVRTIAATPDFPGAIWFTTSCTNKCDVDRPLGNASVDKIVIHDTEGGWDGSVATLQNDAGKSVHYIVDADGSRVGQFVPETYTAWHAGNYYYNETSVGIEHVGYAAAPTGYSDGLYKESVKLVKSIRTRWSVPLDRTHIVGHYQIPNGNDMAESSAPCTATLQSCEDSADYGGADNHRDPGFNWQWCQYMQSLGGTCTCNDAWPLWNCTTDLAEAVRCNEGVVEIEACGGGCDVEAVGANDICHTTPASTVDAGVDAPQADGGGGSAAPLDPGGGSHAGGCAVGGGDAGWLLVLGALALVRRRAR